MVVRWDGKESGELCGGGVKEPSSAKQSRVEVGEDVLDGGQEGLAATGGTREKEVGDGEVDGMGKELNSSGEAVLEAVDVDESPPESIELSLPLG